MSIDILGNGYHKFVVQLWSDNYVHVHLNPFANVFGADSLIHISPF